MNIITRLFVALFFGSILLSNLSYAEVSDKDDAGSGDKILIGMSAAFSGQSKNLGFNLYNGMMAYFDYVNENGGIDGRKIEVIAYDDGYNPHPALRNTIDLVYNEDVFLLMNYVGTPTVTVVLPALKAFKSKNIFLFFPFTGAEPQRKGPYMDYVFNLRPSYLQETAWLVSSFVDIGRPKIAVFYQADAYGRSGWHGVRAALSEHGYEIVGEATYKRGEKYSSSYKEQVDLLMKNNPDAVISIGSYEAAAGFIRDARDAGWDIPIANLSFADNESIIEILTEEGAKYSKDYTVNLISTEVVPNYENVELPAVRQYREIMVDYVPKLPSSLRDKKITLSDFDSDKYGFVSFEGFLNAKMLVEVLRRMQGNIAKSHIREVVLGINDYDIGVGENVSYGPGDNQGLDRIYFNTVIDGKLVPVEDWSVFKK